MSQATPLPRRLSEIFTGLEMTNLKWVLRSVGPFRVQA